jgi:hypothetical protein
VGPTTVEVFAQPSARDVEISRDRRRLLDPAAGERLYRLPVISDMEPLSWRSSQIAEIRRQ